MSNHPFDGDDGKPAYVPPAGDTNDTTPPAIYTPPSGYSSPYQPLADHARQPQNPVHGGVTPYGYAPPQQASNGSTYATLSIVAAAIGIFVLGIILGPVSIFLATKAEKLGTRATVGKIMGWVVTGLSAVVVLVGMISMMGSYR